MGFWKKIFGKKETKKEDQATHAMSMAIEDAVVAEKSFLSECQTEGKSNIVCDLLLQSTAFFVNNEFSNNTNSANEKVERE